MSTPAVILAARDIAGVPESGFGGAARPLAAIAALPDGGRQLKGTDRPEARLRRDMFAVVGVARDGATLGPLGARLQDEVVARRHAGSGDAFEPALALYRSVGFANGEAFGGYASTRFNQFLHLDLAQDAGGL